jgi:hypothetical protein
VSIHLPFQASRGLILVLPVSGIEQDTSDIVQQTTAIAVKAVSISHKMSDVALNVTLDKLRRVQGASWDLYRVCLPKTRVRFIDEQLAWVSEPDGKGAKILLLTAVAGAGKSTIAHTIAQRCHENGQLVSSFFFDRETDGRNNPSALFTTIAADLSRVDPRLAACITDAIENDRGLPLAPLSRQFEELILKPCQGCPVPGPLVIVIDALDEGWDEDMLEILRDRAANLPGSFRIFLTSRMRPELASLCQKAHVRSVNLDIEAPTNMQDIALFIPYRLKRVADHRGLGDDWPGEELRRKFEARAGGLFIWVTTLCDYLQSRADPTWELNKLLSASGLTATSAEAKMNKLYATILASYDWDDERFVAGYHWVMGTAIASKTPLTMSAQNKLLNGEPVASNYVLQQLSPLLTGTSEGDHHTQPVRVLHQSLRDFLVVRADSSTSHAKFQIVEKTHSQKLALLCLGILNRDLNEHMPGVGYLAQDESELPGIPTMRGVDISEALWYACQFWMDHILDVESSNSAAVGEAFCSFMETKAVLWMELMAARALFQGLMNVRRWVQVSIQCFSEAMGVL